MTLATAPSRPPAPTEARRSKMTAQQAARSIAFDLTRASDALLRGKPNSALVLVELALSSAQALDEALPCDHLVVGELVVESARPRGAPWRRAVHLSPRAFELLTVLAPRPGHAWSRRVLYQRVWGSDLSAS